MDVSKKQFTDKILLLYYRKCMQKLENEISDGCNKNNFDIDFHKMLQTLYYVRDVIL